MITMREARYRRRRLAEGNHRTANSSVFGVSDGDDGNASRERDSAVFILTPCMFI